MSGLRLRVAGRSDVGLVRVGNEDSGYAAAELILVADGMGGHAAGEVASSVTAEQVVAASTADAPAAARLDAGVRGAEAGIAEAVEMDEDLAGMGTTLTAATLEGDELVIAHIGDSRAYLLRDGELQRLTEDHTFVQRLIDAGSLTPAEAVDHPARSVLTQALDGTGASRADVLRVPVLAGDRVLLCSDGLSGVVPAATIGRLLATPEAHHAVDALIRAALDAGAPDNVTVVIADVVEVSGDDTGDEAAADRPLWLGAADKRVGPPEEPPPLPVPTGADALAGGTDDEEPPPSGRGASSLVGAILMVVGVLGLAFSGFYAWAATQWYVGVDTGRVTVSRGLPGGIAGLPVGGTVEITEIRVDNLPQTERAAVTAGISADDATDADAIVARLRTAERQCIAAQPAVGCPA